MFPLLTDLVALLGISVVACAGCARLWRAHARDRSWWWLALCFALLWVPVGAAPLPVVAYIRGITSDLSLTCVLVAGLGLCQRVSGLRLTDKRETAHLYATLAAVAVCLYPLALGWGDWDAYRPGWGNWALWAGLLLAAWASLMRGFMLLPMAIAIALLGWVLGLMESTNFWDYLLDPWLAIAAIVACARTALGKLSRVFSKAGMVPYRRSNF